MEDAQQLVDRLLPEERWAVICADPEKCAFFRKPDGTMQKFESWASGNALRIPLGTRRGPATQEDVNVVCAEIFDVMSSSLAQAHKEERPLHFHAGEWHLERGSLLFNLLIAEIAQDLGITKFGVENPEETCTVNFTGKKSLWPGLRDWQTYADLICEPDGSFPETHESIISNFDKTVQNRAVLVPHLLANPHNHVFATSYMPKENAPPEQLYDEREKYALNKIAEHTGNDHMVHFGGSQHLYGLRERTPNHIYNALFAGIHCEQEYILVPGFDETQTRNLTKINQFWTPDMYRIFLDGQVGTIEEARALAAGTRKLRKELKEKFFKAHPALKERKLANRKRIFLNQIELPETIDSQIAQDVRLGLCQAYNFSDSLGDVQEYIKFHPQAVQDQVILSLKPEHMPYLRDKEDLNELTLLQEDARWRLDPANRNREPQEQPLVKQALHHLHEECTSWEEVIGFMDSLEPAMRRKLTLLCDPARMPGPESLMVCLPGQAKGPYQTLQQENIEALFSRLYRLIEAEYAQSQAEGKPFHILLAENPMDRTGVLIGSMVMYICQELKIDAELGMPLFPDPIFRRADGKNIKGYYTIESLAKKANAEGIFLPEIDEENSIMPASLRPNSHYQMQQAERYGITHFSNDPDGIFAYSQRVTPKEKFETREASMAKLLRRKARRWPEGISVISTYSYEHMEGLLPLLPEEAHSLVIDTSHIGTIGISERANPALTKAENILNVVDGQEPKAGGTRIVYADLPLMANNAKEAIEMAEDTYVEWKRGTKKAIGAASGNEISFGKEKTLPHDNNQFFAQPYNGKDKIVANTGNAGGTDKDPKDRIIKPNERTWTEIVGPGNRRKPPIAVLVGRERDKANKSYSRSA